MINLIRAVWLIVFLLSSAFLPFLLCASAWSAEPLRISVSLTPLSLPFFVADHEGYFAAEGVTVKITEVIGGHRAFLQIVEGSADLATVSETIVTFNSYKRDDFAVIATFVKSTDDVKIVSREDAMILEPRQLAGKRVATVVGSSSHYYLYTSLILNGVDPKDVQLVNLQPEAMAEALEKREVDAVAIWEPFPFIILAKVHGTKLLPFIGDYEETFNLIIDKKIRGTRDSDLIKVLRALRHAETFINETPQRAQDILRKHLNLDQSFVEWIWRRFSYHLSLRQSLLTTLEGEARWARQEKLIDDIRSPNFLEFIYSKPLREVESGDVNITE